MIILLTEIDQTIRGILNALEGVEMVGTGSDFYIWKWKNPNPADLAIIEADAKYIGTVNVQ